MELGEQEVGPAYSTQGSADLARVENNLDILNNKIKELENMMSEKEWLEKNEYIARNQYVEERLDAIESVNRCDETALTNKFAIIGVNTQLQEV